MPRPPSGHVDMTQAEQITGYSRRTIQRALARREIPGAYQRTAGAAWFFTEVGLNAWSRGETAESVA